MTERGRPVQLYSLIMIMDLLVIIMFYVITTPTPTVQAYQVPSPSIRQTVAVSSGTPTRLLIESIGIDLPVDRGTYDALTNTWTLGDQLVYYADNSVPVNNSNGTSLIYGHAREGLFGSLETMQVGAMAAVYTDNGQIFRYRYQSMQQFDPGDTSIFTSNGPPMLALQTCAGEWDMYRSVYKFYFVGRDKA